MLQMRFFDRVLWRGTEAFQLMSAMPRGLPDEEDAMPRFWLLGLLALLASLALPLSVSAENFFDLFIGAAITEDTDVTLQGSFGRVTASGRLDTAFAVGSRFGHLYEGLPWLGISIGGSYAAPDVKLSLESVTFAGQELTVVPISIQALFRVPGLLKTDEVPHGRLQPYAAVGPALFISMLDARIGTQNFSDTSLDVGLDARVGLNWQFDRHIGLFTEYRYTYVEPSWEDVIQGSRNRLEATLHTHYALVEVSLRWQGGPN
jgi:hypothetical protein